MRGIGRGRLRGRKSRTSPRRRESLSARLGEAGEHRRRGLVGGSLVEWVAAP